MCVIPRRHSGQVPYCSLRAVTPHDAYVFTNQSFPAFMPGVPVSRGPIESNNDWARRGNWELSIPSFQIARMTGSGEAYC